MRFPSTLFLIALHGMIFAFGSPENPGASLAVPSIDTPPELNEFIDMKPAARLSGKLAEVRGFTQRVPSDGQPASQRTEVYLCHDADTLYVAFIAFDDEPQKIRARMAPRSNVFGDDTVNIMIDTFSDQRRAYTFLSTARGIQWDATWTEGTEFDASFDTVWKSDAQLTDRGFVVLMSIPFKSLRFPSGPSQNWRVMFNRDMPRRNEDTFWPAYTSRIQGRLNQTAHMTINTNLSAGRNIQLIPYGTFRSFELLDPNGPDGPGFYSEDGDEDVGLDAKFVFKDSFVLDATLNPDFSQVESDEPQITVNERFEVFFPERRPFFLENADLFSTPTSMLFTRRIAEPKLGLRLTGKTGPYALGAMLVDDEAPGKRLSPDDENFGEDARAGVFRVVRDVSSQSKIGLLYTGREFAGDTNHVATLDGRVTWNKNWNTQYQFSGSNTERGDADYSGHFATIAHNRSGRHWTSHLHAYQTSEDFETELGFLEGRQRPRTRNFHQEQTYRWWPEGKYLLNWGPNLFTDRTWDWNNVRLDEEVALTMVWAFRGQTELVLFRNWRRERLRPGDVGGVTETLDFSNYRNAVEFASKYFSKMEINLAYNWGTSINFVPAEGMAPFHADAENGSLTLVFRPLTQLQNNNTFLYRKLDDSLTGDRVFANRILRSRWNWQFTRELSLRAILQYDSLSVNEALTSLKRRRNINGDVLVSYLINPWTALYVGYNSNYRNVALIEPTDPHMSREIALTDRDLLNDSHQFFLKFSYLMRY